MFSFNFVGKLWYYVILSYMQSKNIASFACFHIISSRYFHWITITCNDCKGGRENIIQCLIWNWIFIYCSLKFMASYRTIWFGLDGSFNWNVHSVDCACLLILEIAVKMRIIWTYLLSWWNRTSNAFGFRFAVDSYEGLIYSSKMYLKSIYPLLGKCG